MDTITRVEKLIAPTLADMGYELVRVLLTGGRSQTLQIMAERSDDTGMTVDDCAEISRAVSAILDVEDPISGSYQLEVSSPGIDRPLTRPRDYDRYAGYEARIELRQTHDGQRRFRGRLLGLAEDTVRIETEQGPVALPFAEIERAKLILTDDLLKAAQDGKVH